MSRSSASPSAPISKRAFVRSFARRATRSAAAAVILSAALAGTTLAAGNVEDMVQPGDPAAIMVASDRGAEWRSLSVADALRYVPVSRGGTGAVRPAPGPVSTPFHEPGPLWRLGYHPGLDIAAVTGTPIVAAFDGTVVEAEFDQVKGYGNYVKLDHGNGMVSLYGHMSQIGARVGDRVTAGTVIGLVGSTGFSTGPHLHWEVRINGELQDPATYLR